MFLSIEEFPALYLAMYIITSPGSERLKYSLLSVASSSLDHVYTLMPNSFPDLNFVPVTTVLTASEQITNYS